METCPKCHKPLRNQKWPTEERIAVCVCEKRKPIYERYPEAAEEIFREVVNGPETSGPREIIAILKKHFDPAIEAMKPRSVRQVLAQIEDDDEDERPPTDARGVVFPAI